MAEHVITATDPIDPWADTIDSLDVIARIEELQEVLSEYEELAEELMGELMALRDFAKEASDYAEDWQYGATLIRDSYFVEYAIELCTEIYDLCAPRSEWHPTQHIDWESVAKDMKQDYTPVTLTLDGHAATYWIR